MKRYSKYTVEEVAKRVTSKYSFLQTEAILTYSDGALNLFWNTDDDDYPSTKYMLKNVVKHIMKNYPQFEIRTPHGIATIYDNELCFVDPLTFKVVKNVK